MTGRQGPSDPGARLAADVAAGVRADDVTFGADDAALLRAVGRAGSLNVAADDLGRSYSRAHKRLETLEAAFGPLVASERGGAGGGGSELTAAGRELLARFERLQAAVAGTAAAGETVFRGAVLERDGELGVVETPAGRLRALVPDADRVQVSVRADAVTLQAGAEAPEPDATSARNRLAGTVEAVDAGDAVATVAVDVGAEAALSALVTTDSVERLGLAPGVDVVASFKATATRATPR
jgi:molybdate transport system regulatory protein